MDYSIELKNVKRIIYVVISSLVMAINLNTFVNAGGLFPGGFTGLTVFIQRIALQEYGVVIPYTLVNLGLNAIPAYIGFKMVGKKFTFYSCLMIFLTSMFVDLLPYYPVTEDVLLIAVFGGIINGISLSIALAGRASSGGTDFIAMAITSKTKASAWNYMFGLNVILLLCAGYVFGWDKALYSLIFQFCSTQILNALHTRYQKRTMFIVCDKPEEIIKEIMDKTHHGITRFEGVGGYSNKTRTMLYTVVNTNEIRNLSKEIKKIDEQAFINVTKTETIVGNFYQEPLD